MSLDYRSTVFSDHAEKVLQGPFNRSVIGTHSSIYKLPKKKNLLSSCTLSCTDAQCLLKGALQHVECVIDAFWPLKLGVAV